MMHRCPRLAVFGLALSLLLAAAPLRADLPPAPGQPTPPHVLVVSGRITGLTQSGFLIDGGQFVWTVEPPDTLGLSMGDEVEVTATRSGVRYFADAIERLLPDGSRVRILPAGGD